MVSVLRLGEGLTIWVQSPCNIGALIVRIWFGGPVILCLSPFTAVYPEKGPKLGFRARFGGRDGGQDEGKGLQKTFRGLEV